MNWKNITKMWKEAEVIKEYENPTLNKYDKRICVYNIHNSIIINRLFTACENKINKKLHQ